MLNSLTMLSTTAGYDPNERPIVRSGFSVAAFRVGHSLIFNTVLAHNGAAPTADNLLKVIRLA